MPRRLFQHLTPTAESIRGQRSLRWLGPLLDAPALWQLNRRSIARAVGVGLFSAFIPLPLQMLLATGLALGLRANLPLSLTLVWCSNPLTLPPMLYGSYKLGSGLMQLPARSLPEHLSWAWFGAQMGELWQPLLLGSVVCGLVAGGVGHALTTAYWRWRTARRWRQRKLRRPWRESGAQRGAPEGEGHS
ncbi:MAG: hypothetical protein GAK44_00140 [Pseudomonas delhiensis]|nr:MAG: hypothetical protein GAK44_00140 [Pseudomonas delhiensis]